MELNKLLRAHQAAAMHAGAATDSRVRDGHFATVARYAEKIRILRTARRQAKPPIAAPLAPSVIYGTYAGTRSKPLKAASIASWESEGGALDPAVIPRPRTKSLKLVPQYFVGTSIFSTLAEAVAAHRAQKSAH